MTKMLVLIAAFAATVSAAEAKCTKKSLNGGWSVGFAAEAGTGTIAGGVLNVTVDTTVISLTITSFNSTKCKGTGSGTVSGTPVTMQIATEKIPGSTVSPNHLFITVTGAGSSFQILAHRL